MPHETGKPCGTLWNSRPAVGRPGRWRRRKDCGHGRARKRDFGLNAEAAAGGASLEMRVHADGERRNADAGELIVFADKLRGADYGAASRLYSCRIMPAFER